MHPERDRSPPIGADPVEAVFRRAERIAEIIERVRRRIQRDRILLQSGSFGGIAWRQTAVTAAHLHTLPEAARFPNVLICQNSSPICDCSADESP